MAVLRSLWESQYFIIPYNVWLPDGSWAAVRQRQSDESGINFNRAQSGKLQSGDPAVGRIGSSGQAGPSGKRATQAIGPAGQIDDRAIRRIKSMSQDFADTYISSLPLCCLSHTCQIDHIARLARLLVLLDWGRRNLPECRMPDWYQIATSQSGKSGASRARLPLGSQYAMYSMILYNLLASKKHESSTSHMQRPNN